VSGRPASVHRRWPGLDGLRALAVVAVVTFHFLPDALPGGFLGVDVFFVLSGYLITRMIVTEHLGFGWLRFGNFYRRRARRLLPALGVLLTAALAAAAFWRDQLTTVRGATLAAAGYVSNWWLAFDHQSYFVTAGRPSMLQHLWSLAVEEQFYLIWPLVAVGVLAAAPHRLRTVAVAVVAAVLASGSALTMAVLAIARNAPYSADASRLYYGTDTHSMGLLLGAAFGALAAGRAHAGLDRDEARGRWLWVTDGLAAGALVSLALIVWSVRESSPDLYRGGFLVVAALTAAATAAVARRGSRLGRALDRRLLRWLAARSYAIYLWHWPVAVVTRPGVDVHWPGPVVLLVRVAATVLLADLTHRLVERPVRTAGLRAGLARGARRIVRVVAGQAPVGARLATAAVAAVVLVACGVLASGPKPVLSAGQKALAAERGGRDLRIGSGPSRTGRPPLPSEDVTTPPISVAALHSDRPTRPAPGPAARAAGRRSLPPISAFGDSVMLGAKQWLDRWFPGGTLDAIEGRQPDPILHDVEQDAASGRLNPLVVISVGDNGLIDPDALRRALQQLGHVPRVVVVNNRVGRAWEAPNNRTIARVVPEFDNARILDWHALSASHAAWFYDDGIHLTPVGAAAYTRLIATAARAQ
jgi:peptidoglycan/LPS O-acetylase OafA/YrhL